MLPPAASPHDRGRPGSSPAGSSAAHGYDRYRSPDPVAAASRGTRTAARFAAGPYSQLQAVCGISQSLTRHGDTDVPPVTHTPPARQSDGGQFNQISPSLTPRLNPHSARGTDGGLAPRDFVPWRFSDAGLRAVWRGSSLPASENLHTSGSQRHPQSSLDRRSDPRP